MGLETIVLILSTLLGIEQILPETAKIKANSVFQLIVGIMKSALGLLKSKDSKKWDSIKDAKTKKEKEEALKSLQKMWANR